MTGAPTLRRRERADTPGPVTVVEGDRRALHTPPDRDPAWDVDHAETPSGQPVLVCRAPGPAPAVGLLRPAPDGAAGSPTGPLLLLGRTTHRLTWPGHPETWDLTVAAPAADGIPTFVARVQPLAGASGPRTAPAVERAVVQATCQALLACGRGAVQG